MQFTADIAIIGPPPLRERIAVIEIRNQMGLTEADGEDRHAYMRLSGGATKYYFLVSQDWCFVWVNDVVAAKFSMETVIRRFLPDFNPNVRLYGFSVQAIVSHWMSQLAAELRGSESEPEQKLDAIGFLDAARNATVLSEVAA